MTLGVVIVSYKTPGATVMAATSALASRVDEVVVVDNASADDTVASLKAIGNSRLTVLVSEVNVGFGTAANRGARSSGDDALVFLNSDAQITSEAIDRLTAELERSDGRAIIGPRLVGPEGAIQHSAGLLPRPFDLSLRSLGFHVMARRILDLPGLGRVLSNSSTVREYAIAKRAVDPTDTNMVSGACFAIGRQAFERLGGFDERFFMYFEDADLCRRAAAAGMPIRYVPSAVVTHIGGASSPDDYHFGPLHARAMRQYLGKWYGPGGSLLAVLLLWLRAVGFSVALRPGAKRAWRALWAAIRDEDPRR